MVDDKNIQEASIEDTLSSIKNIVENEANSASDADIDSILDLTETEMVSSNDETSEELIDIKSFDKSGELKQADAKTKTIAQAQQGDDAAIDTISQVLKADEDVNVDDILNNLNSTAEQAAPVSDAAEDVNIDDILATTATTDEVAVATNEADVDVDQIMAQAQPSTTDALTDKAEMLENASKSYDAKDFEGSEDTIEEDVLEQNDSTPEEIAAVMKDVAKEALTKQATKKIALKAVPGATGLQVGFPMEVLAEALRPMISGWVEENLPTIVEKLVKEELTKLADK